MARLRGKCAMLGLLDRATKLTTPGEKRGRSLTVVRQRLDAAVAEDDPQTWQRISALRPS